MKTCTICGEKHLAKGFCSKHYRQYKRTGDPTNKELTSCGIDGCTNEHYAKGLCKKHYMKIFRTKR
jgi:hypothetical protein